MVAAAAVRIRDVLQSMPPEQAVRLLCLTEETLRERLSRAADEQDDDLHAVESESIPQNMARDTMALFTSSKASTTDPVVIED